jgi:hypothetical protein
MPRRSQTLTEPSGATNCSANSLALHAIQLLKARRLLQAALLLQC